MDTSNHLLNRRTCALFGICVLIFGIVTVQGISRTDTVNPKDQSTIPQKSADPCIIINGTAELLAYCGISDIVTVTETNPAVIAAKKIELDQDEKGIHRDW